MSAKTRVSPKRPVVRRSKRGPGAVGRVSRKELLEGLLAEGGEVLRGRLQRLRDQLTVEPPSRGDEVDKRTSYVSRDLEMALAQLDWQTLRTVNTALKRLEAGEYGRCNECFQAIAPARLQALPFADLCVLCQEGRESRARTRAPAKVEEPNGERSEP
jgi:DnaK suppressor protein